jgi:hypothetical protein
LVWPELTSFSSVQSVLEPFSAISWKYILQPLVGAIDDLAAQGSGKQ